MQEILKKETAVIKASIVDLLHETGVSVKEIILFGSRARGDADRFSDFDILVITGRMMQINEKMMLSREIRQELARTGIDADIIIKSEEERGRLSNRAGSVVRNALREGVAI